MFAIDKDVPAPEFISRARNNAKYPFAKLQVGESFFVPGVKAKTLSNASQHHRDKHGMQFRCVSIDGGARCWRVA